MHLLEKYSLDCGINPNKLKKAKIFEAYYPIPEKYIVVQPFSGMPSKNYSYFQDFIDIIWGQLRKNGYEILQIGSAKDGPLMHTIQTNGKTTINQCFYIIKNASLLISNDSFSIHAASHYGVPLIGMYGATLPESCGPFWKNENQTIIEADLKGRKPALSVFDKNFSIDSINIETVIDKISEKLEIKLPKIETLFIGENYKKNVIEIIPSSSVNTEQNLIKTQNIPIQIRLDKLNSDLSPEHLQDIGKIISDKKCSIYTKEIDYIKNIPFAFFKNQIEFLAVVINRDNYHKIDEIIQALGEIRKLNLIAGIELEEKDFSEEEMLEIKTKAFEKTAIKIKPTKANEKEKFKKILSKIKDKIQEGSEDTHFFAQTSKLIFCGEKKFNTTPEYLENKISTSCRINLQDIKNINTLEEDLENVFIFSTENNDDAKE